MRASLEHLGDAIDRAPDDAAVIVVEISPGVALASITRRSDLDQHRDLANAYVGSLQLRDDAGLSASRAIPVLTVAACGLGVAVWPGIAERRSLPESRVNSSGGAA